MKNITVKRKANRATITLHAFTYLGIDRLPHRKKIAIEEMKSQGYKFISCVPKNKNKSIKLYFTKK